VSLTAPELAETVDRLRPSVLGAKCRRFPKVALEDLEDAYSKAVETILRNRVEFEVEAEVARYLHTAVENLARNIAVSGGQVRTEPLTDKHLELPGDGPEPEEVALSSQGRVVLREFLAEQASDTDRTIAYLALDSGHSWHAHEIARALDLPHKEVASTLKRQRISLSRFAAQLARPGAFCHRRRPDVLEWQRTGAVPLPLRIHMGHCASCRAQYRDAAIAAHQAILPLLPATGVPLAGAGALTHTWHAIAAHHVTQRVDDAMGRWRKVAPVGGGGGGAVVIAKLAAAGTVVTVTAALHAITPTTPPRHHHPHTVRRHPATIVATTATPPPPAVHFASTHTTVVTRHVSTPRVTTTATTSTTQPPPSPEAYPTHTSSRPRATVASAGGAHTTTSSSSSSSSQAATYPPAPDQVITRPRTTDSSGTSLGPPPPGAPPPP
jgi:DNA-directed RNA polymerase specialized sigma24 family protein